MIADFRLSIDKSPYPGPLPRGEGGPIPRRGEAG